MSILNYLKHPIVTTKYLREAIPAVVMLEVYRQLYNQSKSEEDARNLLAQIDRMESSVREYMPKLFPKEVNHSLSKLEKIRTNLEGIVLQK